MNRPPARPPGCGHPMIEHHYAKGCAYGECPCPVNLGDTGADFCGEPLWTDTYAGTGVACYRTRRDGRVARTTGTMRLNPDRWWTTLWDGNPIETTATFLGYLSENATRAECERALRAWSEGDPS